MHDATGAPLPLAGVTFAAAIGFFGQLRNEQLRGRVGGVVSALLVAAFVAVLATAGKALCLGRVAPSMS